VSISTADLSAAKSLVSTYSVILKSRTVVNEVIDLSGVNYSYEQMLNMVEAKAVDNTEVFSITVTSSNPMEAEMLANLYAQVLPEKIAEIVNGTDAKIVDYAVIAAKRSSPSYTKNTAVGAMAGLVIAAAIVVIGFLRDDVIHSEDYLTKTYPNIPLLTVVPDLISTKSNGYGYYSSSVKKTSTSVRTPSDSISIVNNEKSPFVVETKDKTDGEDNG
jgi:capsular polysaccharide biosynthesis protein